MTEGSQTISKHDYRQSYGYSTWLSTHTNYITAAVPLSGEGTTFHFSASVVSFATTIGFLNFFGLVPFLLPFSVLTTCCAVADAFSFLV